MRDEMGEWTDRVDDEDTAHAGQTEAPDAESADAEHLDSVAVDQGEPIEQAEQTDAVPLHAPPIRTLLKQFSEQFTVDVGPLIEPIRQATETLADASDDLTVRALLPDLRDLLHHVRVLTEKVAEQQAYVLIFGPLKSGKSTFMNAICSAYVSEVTSLPAYPCIVNVTHDTTPSFTVTRYDGQVETHTAQGDVYEVVQQAHSDLMATIRSVEDDGEDFDPAVHMPQAIRNIDVRLPTGDLAESGAVLVDTPGLYSRMKFGYDRLTRDFRNTAACAIFIVKTDNLFLEQVFAEFHELLDLFSRVFLIVNLDTTKQDLDPTGHLVPSLEHDDPGRIIDAFTDLAMSAPLKTAADAGRLRIYPVDLLGAASERILAFQPSEGGARRAHGQQNFDILLTDLTDYLNSSEYLRAFLNDSLRRAGTLLGDLEKITRHEAVGQLVDEADSLTQARAETLAQREAIERLGAVDWSEQSEALHRFLLTQAQDQSEEVKRITGHALVGAIDSWFDNDQSLAALKDDEIDPLLNTCRKQFVHFLRGEMAQQMPGMRDAIAVAGAVLNDAEAVDIDLGALTRAATEDASPAAALMPIRSSLSCEQIPVSRRFWDWLLMRSKTSVRRRLFGPSGSPGRRITSVAKGKRLGELGQATMHEITAAQFGVLINDAVTALPRELVTSYVANLAAPLAEAIADRDARTAARLADIEARLANAQRILAELKTLAEHADQTSEAVTALKEQFGFEDFDQDPSPEDDDEQDQDLAPADPQEPDTADADEFDDLYAPYIAEASALGDLTDAGPSDEETPPTPDADDATDEPAAGPEDDDAPADDEPEDDDAVADAESQDDYALADVEPVTKDQAVEADEFDDPQTAPETDDDTPNEPVDDAPQDDEPADSPDDTPWDAEATVLDMPPPIGTAIPEATDELGTAIDLEPSDGQTDPLDDDSPETDPQNI